MQMINTIMSAFEVPECCQEGKIKKKREIGQCSSQRQPSSLCPPSWQPTETIISRLLLGLTRNYGIILCPVMEELRYTFHPPWPNLFKVLIIMVYRPTRSSQVSRRLVDCRTSPVWPVRMRNMILLSWVCSLMNDTDKD